MKISHFIIICLCALLLSCGADDAVEYALEGCSESGAPDLRAKHRDILEYAGWLGYVTDHTGRIDYYDDRTSSSDGNVGYAICQPGECYVEIATKNRSDIEIGATLVHEAAHLAGGCKNESFPQQMHGQFLEDYYAKADGGELFTNKIPFREIKISGSIQDMYPLPGTSSIALILEDQGDGFLTDLYIYNTDTGGTEQISHTSGKRVRFPRKYSSYYEPVYLNQLTNPWSSDGQKVVTVVEDRDGKEELTVFDLENKTFRILSAADEFTRAVFSPNDEYLAVCTANAAETVKILDTATGEILFGLPSYYIGENRIFAWGSDNILMIYNQSRKQIDIFDIRTEQTGVLYGLGEEDVGVTGLYASERKDGAAYAVISTASSQGYKKIVKISISGSAEMPVENMTGNAPPAVSFQQDRVAFFSNNSDSATEEQLHIRNLSMGTENIYLDSYSQKGTVFFLTADQVLVSTVRIRKEDFRFDYRIWLLTLTDL